MHAWKFAYSQARKSELAQLQMDKVRFKNRINETNEILSPILSFDHREKIFNERFREKPVNHITQ